MTVNDRNAERSEVVDDERDDGSSSSQEVYTKMVKKFPATTVTL